MPAANRGRRLRRLSPVTFYAALGELPRGADERHKDAPNRRQPQFLQLKARNSPPDRLGSLALRRHAFHVTVRFKCDVMSALF
jgi:hypothetical protein